MSDVDLQFCANFLSHGGNDSMMENCMIGTRVLEERLKNGLGHFSAFQTLPRQARSNRSVETRGCSLFGHQMFLNGQGYVCIRSKCPFASVNYGLRVFSMSVNIIWAQ